MDLSGLLPLLDHHRGYQHILRSLMGPFAFSKGSRPASLDRPHVITSLVDPAKPYLLARLAGDLHRPILVVVSTEARARVIVQQIAAWREASSDTCLLPAAEPLFYERLPSHPTTTLDRLRALQTLASGRETAIVIASVRALMRPVEAPDRFRALGRTIHVNDRVRPDDLVATLLQLGYTSESLVEYASTFSRRGGIVDVYPVDAEDPLRLEFFGDRSEEHTSELQS